MVDESSGFLISLLERLPAAMVIDVSTKHSL